jgi:hypothetical protein
LNSFIVVGPGFLRQLRRAVVSFFRKTGEAQAATGEKLLVLKLIALPFS